MSVRIVYRLARGCFLALAAWLSIASAQSPDLAAKAQRGKQAMAEGNFEVAAQVYAELAKAIPDNPGLLLNLGMARHMAGKDSEAVAPLKSALKIDAGIFPANLFLGASYLRLGQPSDAIAPLQKAAQLQPDYPDVRAMLGDALLELNRPAEAVDHYQKLTQLKPQEAGGWGGLGQSYERLAQNAFERLEKAAPESAYTLAVLARVRASQQQYSSAFYLYKQALEREPPLRGIHQAIADIYRRTEHADWADIELKKEQAAPPLNCQAETIACSWQEGQLEKTLRLARAAQPPESFYWQIQVYDRLAAQAFAKLSSLPPSLQRHQLMTTIFSRSGRYGDAVKELRAALQLSPGNVAVERELVSLLYLSRDYQAAVDASSRLLAQFPDDAELNWFRGDSLMFLQKVEEAIPPLKKAVEKNPELRAAQHALGRAYMQIGQDSAAVPHLKAALPLDQDGSLHYQLGQAYRSAGQLDLAKEMIARSQQLQRQARTQQREAQEQVQISAP